MTRKGERITINRLRFVRPPGNLLVKWWFLNGLSPAFAAASAEYAPMKKPREVREFD